MKYLAEEHRRPHRPDRKKIWEDYKEAKAKRSKYQKATCLEDYNKIIFAFFKVVREYWIKSTGGVYVSKLGYFGVYRTPHKTMRHRDKFSYIDRLETSGYMFILSHFTDLKTWDSFSGFDLNETFNSRLTKEFYKEIHADRRYTLNNFLIKEYLKKRTHL